MIPSDRKSHYLLHMKKILQPMMVYYFDRFNEETGSLRHLLSLFKCLEMFNSYGFSSRGFTPDDIRLLSTFEPFKGCLDALVAELPEYSRLSTNVDSSVDILGWFRHHKDFIPSWYHYSCIAALFQPSSAAAERVFSIINRISKTRMTRMLHDYVETTVML